MASSALRADRVLTVSRLTWLAGWLGVGVWVLLSPPPELVLPEVALAKAPPIEIEASPRKQTRLSWWVEPELIQPPPVKEASETKPKVQPKRTKPREARVDVVAEAPKVQPVPEVAPVVEAGKAEAEGDPRLAALKDLLASSELEGDASQTVVAIYTQCPPAHSQWCVIQEVVVVRTPMADVRPWVQSLARGLRLGLPVPDRERLAKTNNEGWVIRSFKVVDSAELMP